MNRREFLLSVAIAIGASTSLMKGVRAQMVAPWNVRPLPYAYDALEPVVSEDTLRTHHREYVKYVKTANELIEEDSKHPLLKRMSIEQIIKTQRGGGPVFDNVVQMWNNMFYFRCISPSISGSSNEYHNEPDTLSFIAQQLKKDFGTLEKLVGEMKAAALEVFGSGWAWLSWDGNKRRLVVTNTSGAGNPMVEKEVYPLLTINVFEHAYNPEYQEKHEDYVDVYFDKLVNWETVDMEITFAPGIHDTWEPVIHRTVRDL